MQLSLSATGTAASVRASVADQVAREKARVAKEASDFAEHILNTGDNIKKHKKERPFDPAPLATAAAVLDTAAAHVDAELAHVSEDTQVAVSVAITVHRPDPE